MRILWVKAGKLLPVDTGGKIRSYNLLKHLAVNNEVTLLSYYGGPLDKAYEEEIHQHFPKVVCINTNAPDSAVGTIFHYLRHLVSPVPYAVTKFTSPVVRQLLHKWDREDRFDVAVCDFLSASSNFPRLVTTPAVLFQHNVESTLWERQWRHERGFVKRLVFRLEATKMLRYERAEVQRFHHVIAVSEHDRALMSQMTEPSRISVVPTGVDLKQYAPLAMAESSGENEALVLFLGSMDWEANIDGVDYFMSEIWPRVRAAVPDARFRVVGRNPPPRIRNLGSDSVEVTGRVPSVLEHLNEASVFVVPLRIGGGTRLKIYEAMAAGKAVVSTSIGAEGLDVQHGEDVLLADTANTFAESVTTLLRDRKMRRRLGQAAANRAARYDWTVVASCFEEKLERTIKNHGTALSVSSAPVSINV